MAFDPRMGMENGTIPPASVRIPASFARDDRGQSFTIEFATI
jgi:hypothetical protein